MVPARQPDNQPEVRNQIYAYLDPRIKDRSGRSQRGKSTIRVGRNRLVKARFSALCSHYLFDAGFCNVASGWEKGVVEKNVQDSRRRIWQDAAKERFGAFAELNVRLLARSQTRGQELRRPAYAKLTVAEMLEHEQPELMQRARRSKRWKRSSRERKSDYGASTKPSKRELWNSMKP